MVGAGHLGELDRDAGAAQRLGKLPALGGGHEAVRAEICEDRALAARVKQAGRRFRMLGAEHLAQTRMYTDLASLWEGFSKNVIEIMGEGPSTIAVATAGMVLAWAALLLPILTGLDLLLGAVLASVITMLPPG